MSAATHARSWTETGRAQGPSLTQYPAPSTQHHLFEALVRTHQDRLYGFAYRLAGNRDDAEDLLQQSLIEAYAAFDRFEIGSHFDRWVFRIMHHTFLDTVRRRPRWAMESLDAVWENADGGGESTRRDVPDPRSGPETELMAKTLSEPLQRALDGLPSDFRSVVVLADMQELSYEEVARVLGCPVGTVRSRLHRARNMLRRALIGDAGRQHAARGAQYAAKGRGGDARREPRARLWSERMEEMPVRQETWRAA